MCGVPPNWCQGINPYLRERKPAGKIRLSRSSRPFFRSQIWRGKAPEIASCRYPLIHNRLTPKSSRENFRVGLPPCQAVSITHPPGFQRKHPVFDLTFFPHHTGYYSIYRTMDSGSQTQQRDALSEGRRIYVGNLLYSIKPADVEDLMRQTGFDQSFEQLHISIDPVSGRNPGYCFVEFTTREEADRALEVLAGASLFNRAIKVGPCNPKSSSQRESRWNSSRGDDYKPTFQRWGDWKGGEDSQSGRREGEQGPQGAARHLDDRSRRNPEKAQLYIGGLGMMTD